MVNARISDVATQNSMIQNMLTNQTKVNSLEQEVSSGLAVTQPSDNPEATVGILNCTNALNDISTYSTNITSATSELNVTNSAVSGIVNVITQAQEVAEQASNATNGTTQLKAMSDQIGQLLSEATGLGNTSFEGKYVFGGVVTGTPPYTTGSTTGIQYTGTPSTDPYQRNVQIGDGVTATINTTGDQLLGQYYQTSPGPPAVYTGSGLIQTLSVLQNQLNASPPDYTAISSSLSSLNTNATSVETIQANLGATTAKLNMTQNQLSNNKISYTQMQSNLQDVDMAQAVSNLSFQETALQTSLEVTAKISQLSLLNYMSA